MLTKTVIFTLLASKLVLGIPPNDKALFDDDNPEARHRKRYRPCRGGGRNNPQGQGRTFFDWSISYVDVNYNYNYNINCGGGGGGGQHGQHDGGGGAPNKPILMGILQGVANRPPGGGLFGDNGPVNFVQTQAQGIFSNLGSLLPQDGLGSLLPQGGLFNGQGISSLFDNGLFSGIFNTNRPNPAVSNPSNPPPINNPRPPPSQPSFQVTTQKPGGQDPDDIIYNDERPVHEDHDPVVPDYGRPRPVPSYRPYYYNYNYQGASNNYYNRQKQYQNRHPNNRIRFT